jgi:hypothetical protein
VSDLDPRDREVAERLRTAVEAVSFAWATTNLGPSSLTRKPAFDLSVLDRDAEVRGRLSRVTRHELNTVCAVLEAIDRAARNREPVS